MYVDTRFHINLCNVYKSSCHQIWNNQNVILFKGLKYIFKFFVKKKQKKLHETQGIIASWMLVMEEWNFYCHNYWSIEKHVLNNFTNIEYKFHKNNLNSYLILNTDYLILNTDYLILNIFWVTFHIYFWVKH